jgi:fused signal recognition particle receptor
MFGFLKDKLKQALSKFSKDVKKEVEDEEKKTKSVKQKKSKAVSKKKNIKYVEAPVKFNAGTEAFQPDVDAIKNIASQKKSFKKQKEEKQQDKPGFFSRMFGKKDVPVETKESHVEEDEPVEKFDDVETEETEEELEDDELTPEEAAFEEGEEDAEGIEEPKEQKGFFSKIAEAVTKTSLSNEKFESLFWDLELILLENNVAVEVIDKIKEDMKETLVKGKISRFDVDASVLNTLKKSINDILTFDKIDLLKEAKKKKPLVLAFVGVNGSGKTTTIAKLAHYFQKNKLSVVMAAAIQQLEEHANKLGTKIIKQDYGADAAAVAFDAVKYAQAKNIDVVLIDTAGRLHTNLNLVDEMKKIIRVAKPDYKLFVGESITGNDCIEQAEQFNEAIGIDGIILTKADVDEKGGAAISVSYVTKKPIVFIGLGQTYDDMKPFDKNEIIKTLGL